MACAFVFTAKGRPQPLPPQVLAGGAAALVAASREDPELPRRVRSQSNLPAPREAIPSPTLGQAPPLPPGIDLPAPRGASLPPNLPAPREAVPAPASSFDAQASNGTPPMHLPPPMNLPAPRGAVPVPVNLPAPREAIAPPNLPAAREDIAPPNLPAPREAIAPPNLPASRDAMPAPQGRTQLGIGNLPAPRSAVPVPNLPAPRTAVARSNGRPSTPVALARLTLEKAPPEGPAASSSPLSPLSFESEPPSGLDGIDMDISPDEGAPPAAGTLFGLGGVPAPAAVSGLELDLLDMGEASAPPPAPGVRAPEGALAPPSRAPMEAVDGGLGFRLDIEGAEQSSPPSHVTAIVPPSALPAIEVNAMGVLEDSIPTLSPHREEAKTEAPKPSRRPKPVWLIAGAGGVAALVAAAFLLVPILTRGPAPEDVLAPFSAALDRDSAAAYKQAADALAHKAASESHADELRASAAELLLLARLGRDAPKAYVNEAEQLLSQILQNPEPPSVERRARALLEIAKGHAQRAEPLMAGIEDSPGGRLVLGLRHLHGGNPSAAAGSFEVAASAQPERIIARYLTARAQEAAGQVKKAQDTYAKVLAANAGHVGAALGALRTSGQKGDALVTSLEKLSLSKSEDASGAEMAAVSVLLGQTAAELGRTALAPKAFGQALVADPGNVEASLALAEALLREGQFNQAFGRAQSVAIEAQKTPHGLFVLGGAMIATKRTTEGVALVEKAIVQQPRDPRGPYLRAWAAEEAVNPDVSAAIGLYQKALELSPSFVPASLRLASLLQRVKRADDALKVLKAAEDAGAPPTLLQMAWGQALIVAKQPERAEEVFRKALAADPALAPARLGLASALESQGRVGEAKLELDELLVQSPDTDGLRERLAGLALRLGERDEAVTHYEAALASGKAGPEVQVALGRLAMEMGKLDVAQTHLVKVAEEAPATPGALYNLGQLRERQGALGKALSEYRRATSYENTPEVQLAYGKVLLLAGKEDDAMLAFREAFALAEAHLEHGRVLLRRSKAEKAIVDFQAAVAIDPEMHDAYLLMGNAYDVLGEAPKAAEAWRNVVRIAPKNVEALYKLGRLEMDRAQVKNALDYLRKAADDVPEDRVWAADVFFQLGYAELQAGSKKNARDALSKYLTLAPTDAPDRPVVEKQLERLSLN